MPANHPGMTTVHHASYFGHAVLLKPIHNISKLDHRPTVVWIAVFKKQIQVVITIRLKAMTEIVEEERFLRVSYSLNCTSNLFPCFYACLVLYNHYLVPEIFLQCRQSSRNITSNVGYYTSREILRGVSITNRVSND